MWVIEKTIERQVLSAEVVEMVFLWFSPSFAKPKAHKEWREGCFKWVQSATEYSYRGNEGQDRVSERGHSKEL